MRRHVFVTGPPGVGKSTLIQRVLEQLQLQAAPHGSGGSSSRAHPGSIGSPTGFYTEEVRAGGERVGFDVVTMAGQRGPLARAGTVARGAPTVGKYVVDVSSFEALALPALLPAAAIRLVVIDEVGKMELFSTKFYPAVQALLDDPRLLVFGSVPVPRCGRTIPQVEAVTTRPDISNITVSRDNRDQLPSTICRQIQETLTQMEDHP
eukprot:GHUV01007138.1.p2 GENE.GHUV01007138.1~~GHUV01007138.1.p2  ORF type:complete len:207 (+),score=74.77 GHUV01007138.1:776-1396(+)